jgi:hypothetical protein
MCSKMAARVKFEQLSLPESLQVVGSCNLSLVQYLTFMKTLDNLVFYGIKRCNLLLRYCILVIYD